jgi:glycosyltransferase involved in cell wall biosynthesis
VRDIDLIVIGELIERKRLDMLAKVPAHIGVSIVGDGPLRTRLQETFTERTNIKLLGAMPNEDVLDLLHRAKILFHCSDDEGLPRVFGEALACGTPIVCSDRLRCGVDFPKHCVSQAASNRLIELALEKLEDKIWLQQAQLIGKHYMRQNHNFLKIFALFSQGLKHLYPDVKALLP